MSTQSKTTLIDAQKWALGLQIPDRHKVALMGLATFMNEESCKAWPSVRMLADRIGATDTNVVQVTVGELIACGLLIPTKTDALGVFKKGVVLLEVGLELPVDKNPLLSILLQERAWTFGVGPDLPELYVTARVVLHYLAKQWDFTLRASPADYKSSRASLPWVTKKMWTDALLRLRDLGFIENIFHGNQHRLPRYSLDGFINAVSPGANQGSAYNLQVASNLPLTTSRWQADSAGHDSNQGSAYNLQVASNLPLTTSRWQADSAAYNLQVVSNPLYSDARAEQPLNLEEEGQTNANSSSSKTGISKFARALVKELAEELRPGESLGPIIQIEPTTGVEWHESWAAAFADQYRAHHDAGRDSPLGLMFNEVRFTAQTNAVSLAEPSPIRPNAPEPERYELIDSEISPEEAHPEARAAWDKALGLLQVKVTRPNYDTWLKYTVGLDQTVDTFVVGCPNAFVGEMLYQRMYSLIARTVELVLGQEIEIQFVVYAEGQDSAGAEMP